MASWKMVGLEVTPTTPWATWRSNSPSSRRPRRMKSSHTLWPRSKSLAALVMGRLRILSPGALLGEIDRAALRIPESRPAVPPRHVGRSLLEGRSFGHQVGVRAIHVAHHQVDRGLARWAPQLGWTWHRRHEPQARARPCDNEQVVHLRIVLEVGEAE